MKKILSICMLLVFITTVVVAKKKTLTDLWPYVFAKSIDDCVNVRKTKKDKGIDVSMETLMDHGCKPMGYLKDMDVMQLSCPEDKYPDAQVVTFAKNLAACRWIKRNVTD